MQSVSQFANKIKTKYPTYKDMDDRELVDKIVKKYPTYKGQIDFNNDDRNLQPIDGPHMGEIKSVEKPKPTKPNEFEGVTFMGSETLGKLVAPMFPRAARGEVERIRGKKDAPSFGQQFGQATADYYSAPGRVISTRIGGGLAALGLGDKTKTLDERMADTKGSNIADQVLRAPETGAAVVTAPLGAVAGAGKLATMAPRAAGVLSKAPRLVQATKTALAGVLSKAPRLVQATKTALAEGLGSATAGQAERVGEGKDIDLSEAAGEVALSGALPGAGSGVKKIAKWVGSNGNKLIGRIAEEMSGVSEEALRKYGVGKGRGAQELAEAAKAKEEISNDILDVINDYQQFTPNVDRVEASLEKMPDIEIKPIIEALENAKPPAQTPYAKRIAKKIDDEIINMKGKVQKISGSGMLLPDVYDDKIPARQMKDFIKNWDDEIGDKFGKDANNYINALKQARHETSEELRRVAKNTGDETYIQAMDDMANHMKAYEKLKTFLGRNSSTQENRINSFWSTLGNKDKVVQREAVKKIDELLGKDFSEKANLIRMAENLGPEGKATLLPRQFTGKSLIGPITAIGAGSMVNPMLASIGGLASPKLASGVLGTLDKSGQILKRMPKRLIGGPSRALGREIYRRTSQEESR